MLIKIENQPKNKHLFETMMILLKANKNTSYIIFPYQYNIEERNQKIIN
jgi:hypothetical protein